MAVEAVGGYTTGDEGYYELIEGRLGLRRRRCNRYWLGEEREIDIRGGG